jgi:hypothetical protein
MRKPFATAVGGSLALCAVLAFAPAIAATDRSTEQDHLVILELGASGERETSEHTSHIGPAVGLEIEPIENWLESLRTRTEKSPAGVDGKDCSIRLSSASAVMAVRGGQSLSVT